MTWGGGFGVAQNRVRFDHLTVEEGLSQRSVLCILQDRLGFLWVGTEDGLNRYDGYGFKVFRHDSDDPASLSDNYVFSLCEDDDGNLWVGTYNGLNRYDREFDRFEKYKHNPSDSSSISNNVIRTIYKDKRGKLWMGTQGGLNRYDGNQQFTRYVHDPNNPNSLKNNSVLVAYEDSESLFWVGSEGGGLHRMDRETGAFERFYSEEGGPQFLDHNRIWGLEEDETGRLWIGAMGGGLSYYDRKTGVFTHVHADPADPKSLSSNSIAALYKDKEGAIWAGTWEGGLNRLDWNGDQLSFSRFQNDPADPASLSHNIVIAVYEDNNGIVWVGTQGGLNRFERSYSVFRNFTHRPEDPQSLSHSNVVAIHETRTGALWVGTSGGGLNLVDRKTGKSLHYMPGDGEHSLSDDEISSIYKDSSDVLWVGSNGNGLNRYDDALKGFVTFKRQEDDPNSLSNNYLRVIYEDSSWSLWFGTRNGMNLYDKAAEHFERHLYEEANPSAINSIYAIVEDSQDPSRLWVGADGGLLHYHKQSRTFTHYRYDPNDPDSLRNDSVVAIHEGSDGGVWLGTSGAGLNRLDRKTGKFRAWTYKQGLANNVVYGILEDKTGRLWISTNKGISVMNVKEERFTNYGVRDGLLNREFNAGAFFKSPSGEMFFGGVDGFCSFFPEDIVDSEFIPPVAITDFRIANQSAPLDRYQKNSPLKQAIGETRALTLNHRQNMFSFEFAALDFTQPDLNRYRYKMEGYNDEWISTDATNRLAAYTSLPAGSYTFRVQGSNHDGVWNEEGAAIKLRILPPPWWSWWAKSLYGLIILSLVGWYMRLQRERLDRERQISRQQRQMTQQAQQMAEQERKVSSRLRQIDKLKDEFLANTSHELRTPLHGMIGLAESLLDGGEAAVDTRKNLNMIVSAGKRLSNLVNDILDFSQLKNKNLQLRRGPVDVKALADVVISVTQPLVRDKDLKLLNQIPNDLPPVNGDEDRLQQILYNLIGNAVKFTDAGRVRIGAETRDGRLCLWIEDTGIGIPKDKLERVFMSFEQVDGSESRSYGGTGLGLAVTKQLVELHEGRITVKSEPGEGSLFSIYLPLADTNCQCEGRPPEAPPVQEDPDLFEPELEAPAPLASAFREGKQFSILIVDDEPINRQVLLNHLSNQSYKIVEAGSGQEALDLVATSPPFDLILLDVMMPKLSGYEVCRKLREEHPVHELPIIFLTAKTRVTDLISGFDSGANDYLTKPVSKSELLSRVKTHLELLDTNRTLEEKVSERTRHLVSAQKGLMEAAHTAGMAEIATDVLHNVGNTLNSLRISIQMIDQSTADQKWVRLLKKIADLLSENAHDLPGFFANDQRGGQLPEAVDRIAEKLEKQCIELKKESSRMVEHMESMNAVLEDQQKYARVQSLMEPDDLNQLIQDALQVGAYLLADLKVEVRTIFAEDLAPVSVNKARFTRVILCLLGNACEAIAENSEQGLIQIRTFEGKNRVFMEIMDNGVGIPKDDLIRIFSHGFTSKEGRRGFGLHYCANALREMSGNIDIVSEGQGMGARVLLTIPAFEARPPILTSEVELEKN